VFIHLGSASSSLLLLSPTPSSLLLRGCCLRNYSAGSLRDLRAAAQIGSANESLGEDANCCAPTPTRTSNPVSLPREAKRLSETG
jgi:hypothetical protein